MLLTNSDRRPPGDFDVVFTSVGLDKLAFVPALTPKPLPFDAWPTYAELIALRSRLVLLLDCEADVSTVPDFLPQFDYFFFETPFDMVEPTFNQCTFDRGPAGSKGNGLMYIVDHFLNIEVGADVLNIPEEILDAVIPDKAKRVLIPDVDSNVVTNVARGNGSIGAQADLCRNIWWRWPSVVLVDLFSRGKVLEAEYHINWLRKGLVLEGG